MSKDIDNRRLLLVDDDAEVLFVMGRILGQVVRDSNVDLEVFQNPVEALERVKALADDPAPLLVVSDQRMPELVGSSLLRETRRLRGGRVRAILLTSVDSKTTTEAERRHADAVLEKPFDVEGFRELFARLVADWRAT